MKQNLPLILFLLALGMFVGAALALWPQISGEKEPQITFNQPYTMLNQRAEIVTNQTFLGKPTLYFFGFTHCPDVCPTTLARLSGWLHQLPEAPQRLNVVFISVDPERDTPAVLAAYLQSFSPHITGLTGTPEELAKVAEQFMVYYAKVPFGDGTYTMDHSSMIILADAKGTFRGTISHEDDEPTALAKLRKLLK